MNEKTIELKAFAKINLSLDVLGILENGYHEVKMVMQAIKLHDTVKMTWIEDNPARDDVAGAMAKEGSGTLRIHLDPGNPNLPANHKNLAWKAAEKMHEIYCPEKSGVLDIVIEKRIPSSAGLAGGSSDGAAVFLGLSALWDLEIPLSDLCDLAGTVGADAAFSVMAIAAGEEKLGLQADPMAASCALAEGTGTTLTPLVEIPMHILISKPSIGVSTAEVYRGIDRCTIKTHPDVAGQVDAIMSGNKNKVLAKMGNVLEIYSLNHYHRIVYTKNMMQEIKELEVVMMSGSGPSVFAVFEDLKAGEKAFRRMREINEETFLTATLKGNEHAQY